MKESRLMKYKERVAKSIELGSFENVEKFKTKKSLGQNFLNNKGILELIAKSAEIEGGDNILEIGPGEGALTEYLLKEINIKEGSSVMCVEKDHRLISILEKKFEESMQKNKIKISEQDILKWGSDTHFAENKIENFKYKLIANIPYYITGAIISKFLEEKTKPSIMILMVQKEVAQRMVAKDGKESILSLCTKYYADTKIIKIVSKGSFTPTPKIDSAIIKITLKQEKLLNSNYLCLEKKYLSLVKVGLSHKRKTLISNFKKSENIEIGSVNWDKTFEDLSLDKKVRGEDLSFEIWLDLAKKIVYSI